MQPDTPHSSNNEAPEQPGLPPVKPPSGRFIVQLFLIPGLIVAGLVLVFAFGSVAWFGTSSPESFLSRLDSNNADIRWRAAHELAQVLKRPESLELASDPKFALDIAERLQLALAELEEAETAAKKALDKKEAEIKKDPNLSDAQKKERVDQERAAAGRKLAPDRNLALYLMSCLGDFTVPVGVPLLSEVAMSNQSAELKGLVLKRRRAVWALANLGSNMQRHYFGKNAKPEDKVLTNEQKSAILAKLQQEASGNNPDRAKWARTATAILEKVHPGGVDKALEICVRGDEKRNVAPAEDVYLRELVAFALNFWDGDRVEPTLLYLARDDGHGVRIEINEED
jgi:hypothetical protein